MKILAAVLAVVLAFLIGICFLLPEQEDMLSNHESTASTASSETDGGSTAGPTETTKPAETTRPTEMTTAPTEPSQTQAAEPDDSDFVRIADYIPSVRQELAYATTNNFTGTVIYDFTDAYLRYGTVKKLIQASALLEAQGYGLVIWDAYRPVYAQQKLWDICPDPTYVSQPGTGSQSHCRGIAVDVTLYDLQTGELLEMPSGFDEFSSLGDRDYSDCSDAAKANATALEEALKECGFKPYSGEWWHFSDTDSYDIEYNFDPALAG